MPGVKEEIMEKVCTQIQAELDWYVMNLGVASFATVFIGGGTPSVLPGRILKNLFEKIGKTGKTLEWTVEANPETLDNDFLDICKGSGVTRLSLGVQSFHDELLAGLGRRARHKDIMHAMELLSTGWQGDVSLDLITGIPGQSREILFEDISQAMSCKPGHISMYTLTAEERTVLHDQMAARKITLPARDDEALLWDCAVDFLAQNGYSQYEVSNFCKPGKECLHNLRYWLLKPYCGVGPAAVSTLQGAINNKVLKKTNLECNILRIHNPHSIEDYCMGREENWNRRPEEIRPKEFLLENLMMGLRLASGIPVKEIKSRFGKSLEELLSGLWEKWCGRGYAITDGETLRLTAPGRLILNRLLEEAALAIDDAEEIIIRTWD